jgi:hypothetical protein
VRRTLLLALLVAVGAIALVVVEAPHRPTSRELVRGPRLMKAPASSIREISAVLGERRFTATRADGGWRIDGAAAPAGVGAALDDVVQTLVELRAIDAFRGDGLAQFGLETPHGAVTIVSSDGTGGDTERLVLGDFNASGSAIYARRDGDPRVFQIGVFLPSALERVFYQRDDVDRQRPEMG